VPPANRRESSWQHTQIPIFPHQSPALALLGKLISGQNKRCRVKTPPEKSLKRIEYRQNGKTTTKSRAFPAGSIKETQVLMGVYQPVLHKVLEMHAEGVGE
jgi:hypothetical protein